MLDYIKGSIRSIHEDCVSVDIGIMALRVHVPTPSLFQAGQKVQLHMYMHWNAENGPSLFGFASATEREIFLIVIGCSGVGPRLGLAVLEDLGPQVFLDAVCQEDDTMLSKVSGIGPKKAEKMIVYLKHKVAKLIQSGAEIKPSAKISKIHEIPDVLKSLNYSRPEISAVMNHLNKNYTGKECSFDQLIRHALSFLSKSGSAR
ncbi:Holliday junction branch migration protein RuvA [Candidatus Dependentiae bacterium]